MRVKPFRQEGSPGHPFGKVAFTDVFRTVAGCLSTPMGGLPRRNPRGWHAGLPRRSGRDEIPGCLSALPAVDAIKSHESPPKPEGFYPD